MLKDVHELIASRRNAFSAQSSCTVQTATPLPAKRCTVGLSINVR